MNITKTSEVESLLFDLKLIAEVNLPTRWANFRMLGFQGLRAASASGPERQETALALVLGDIHAPHPLVRIHSQCTTGDVFHSLRCDCRDQLHLALRTIADEGSGVLLYEHQEGRGIGLMEKLRAYALQDEGLDTIAANLELGHAIDQRDYRLVVSILHFLKISSLRLMTNNPEKINAVLESGIEITARVAADVVQNPHSAYYMAVKREKLGHFSGTTEADLSARRYVPSVGHADAGGDERDYLAASIESRS
jgi:GTP cyclohydrolase II